MKPRYRTGLAQGLTIGAMALALNGCDEDTTEIKEIALLRGMVSSCLKTAKDLKRLESFSYQKEDLKTFADLVNEIRAKKNAPLLGYGKCAQSMAEYWAKHPKAPTGGHKADGETPATRLKKFDCAAFALENVSWPRSLDGTRIFAQWNAIAEDRANMKYSGISEIGLHCVEDTGVKSGNFCVMVGATPKDAEPGKPGVLNLNEDDFEQEILALKDKPALVEFWATWCTYCKQQDRIFQQLAREFGDKVVFARVRVEDEDENPKLKKRYGSNALPTLAFFNNGEYKGKMEGRQQKHDLRRILRGYLKKK